MKILPVPCLSDNYAYLLVCEETRACAVVDVSEAGPVLVALAASEETLGFAPRVSAILSTHHHHDHVGGNEAFLAKAGSLEPRSLEPRSLEPRSLEPRSLEPRSLEPRSLEPRSLEPRSLEPHSKVPVYAHASDSGRVPAQTELLEEGATFRIGALSVDVLHIPGHTTGAVAYVVGGPGQDRAVFTGDTLFVAGCGRLFEGTPDMMHASLSKLARLPGDTKVYCGHEYTEANLRFAHHVEPGNADVSKAREDAARIRAKGAATVPSTIARELATNPFMRVGSPEIRRSLEIPESASGGEALGVIRKAKDGFKG